MERKWSVTFAILLGLVLAAGILATTAIGRAAPQSRFWGRQSPARACAASTATCFCLAGSHRSRVAKAGLWRIHPLAGAWK